MTESELFKILLQSEDRFDYNTDFPKQQAESVKIIAKNLTEIIYESYKRKSLASTTKRYELLKFINNICEIPEPHVYEDYTNCVLNQIKRLFPCSENEEVAQLKREISLDLKFNGHSFQQKFLKFYERKSAREKAVSPKIDIINERNQQKLSKKFCLDAKKLYTFETNENVIKNLLGNHNCSTSREINNSGCKNENFREVQIKLGYAMINLGQIDILNRILNRISKYEALNKTEKNFLKYIWSTTVSDGLNWNIEKHIQLFYFLLEQVLFKHATNLLNIENEHEIDQYFVNLDIDCDIIKIRKICKIDYKCYLKLKNLLFELYCISFCNENVMKLSEIII